MKQRRVLLLIERQVGFRLSVLEGIFRYTRNLEHWICHGADLTEGAIDALRAVKPDGIIAGLWDLPVARKLVKRHPLVIDVFDWHPTLEVPRVALDNLAIGRMAAGYFLDKGYRQLAFLGHQTHAFSVERRIGFEATAAEAGVPVHIAPESCSMGDVWVARGEPPNGAAVSRWVRSLPKPIAVFCASDGWGVRLTDACHALDVDVPGAISVLGVDNDALLCQLSSPPLSSVRTSAERVGYAAAQMLDQMMEGRYSGPPQVLFPPTDIVERQSTDVLQIGDPDLAMALRFIADHAHQRISLDAIAAHVIVPKRTLQRRFKQALGRSIHQELTRCRLERAKRLLGDSDLSIPQIARRCGLGSRERLSRVFRSHVKQSPIEYRRQLNVGR